MAGSGNSPADEFRKEPVGGREQGLGVRAVDWDFGLIGSVPGFAAHSLCDMGQVLSPCGASVSPFVEQGESC